MRRLPWRRIGAGLFFAALPPSVLHAALAATAGILFEAAPFVLAAEFVGEYGARPPMRWLAMFGSFTGCGCGGPLPGAWSLPATALCWFAFGPWVALGRLALAPAVANGLRRLRVPGSGPGARDEASTGDAFAQLASLAPAAALGSVAAQVLVVAAGPLHAAGTAGALVALAAGVTVGIVLPCATGGVALAAGFAGPLPWATAGLLASAGILRFRPLRRAATHPAPGKHTPQPKHPAPAELTIPAEHPASVEHTGPEAQAVPAAALLLAAALALLAARGPSGLVNPRYVPLDAVGAFLALARIGRRTATTRTWTVGVPLLMLAALVAGSPVPAMRVDAADASDAYPDARLTFTGATLGDGDGTVVERFAIACCRLDASPVAVRLDRRLPVPAGSWVTVCGIFERAPSGRPRLRTEGWRRIARPADPFLYR